MARTRAARISKTSVANRIVPDSSSDFGSFRALLVFVLLPALIIFMSRKAVDRVHSPASYSHPLAGDRFAAPWPAAAHSSGVRRAFPMVPATPDFDPRAANTIYSNAMLLARRYDSRPYWNHPQLTAGVPTTRYTADLAIEHLIPCESMGASVDRIDTNGKMSYGILQFQEWEEWERISGIRGSPDNRADAIRMAEWAIQNGMINRWTCAGILKITS
jgi:hypothetical protein